MSTSFNSLLHDCLRIRRVEQAIANEYSKLECRQPVHLDIGAEWASVAVCSQLEAHDKVFGGHRSHSQFLACGNSVRDLIAGLMGKNDLSSMHLHSDGIFVASGSIVGGMIPVATGAAFAKKIKRELGIVVCFLGDGATEEGVWAESLNFSVLHQLPILFVVHNNKLAVTTPIEDRHTYNICDIAMAYGLGTHDYIDSGVELNLATSMVKNIIDLVRSGKPQLIELQVERERVHCGVEFALGHELKNDCLVSYNIDETSIQQEISEAFEYARSLPAPTNDGITVYAS